ncbi:LacI family transcriptional regulator [Paenibacillus sp. N1-5-1-14]|uniref:LacI family DNA-binding transcriptional regulator n=1 Tax=Paenibacillus radicibacter TaxID=2972488 RepID=UPI00215908F1|nr:LacI family DNA-binding transcriptional regulator [Paenibacillus radicibacter]MCR8643092.1 LacI family transcriptional regulator [Paenibacillus radicibacter]
MKVSIYDVASKCGLSVVTVSRVINNASSVREGNRQKVLQAMKELNYIPNSAARSLARGKTGVVGLVLTTLQDSIFDGVVKEANVQLEAHGYFLALSIDDVNKQRESGSEDPANFLFQEDRVDGVILLSPRHEELYAEALSSKGIPYVLVDNDLSHIEAPMVRVDNYTGGYMAAKHLIELGHSRIGHLYGPDMYLSARERRRGFMKAMEEANLKPVIETQGDFNIRDGFHIVNEWMSQGVEITAMAAADDFLALSAIQALQKHGRRVPEDISVIGYDDQEFASQIYPALTTIKQPADQMGREAVNRLLARINGREIKDSFIELKPQLVVRESTSKFTP